MPVNPNFHTLNANDIKTLLRYEPQTGKLFWLARARELFSTDNAFKTWNTRYAGTEAFTTVTGSCYRQGAIFGRLYYAHRVAWAIQAGEWPASDIDHINGDRADNRWPNLRSVPHVTNSRNQNIRATNTSGVNGVCWFKRDHKWMASIKVDGKQKHLGYFETIEEAKVAREAANATFGFTARHGTTPEHSYDFIADVKEEGAP